MAGLKVYVDLMSQPARAIAMFLKITKIPHELKIVSIAKGEHKTQEYLDNINRFGKIPAIDDNGFKMVESIAILRYLTKKYNVPEHWYPKDIVGQAKVDEFLEWQHLGCRAPLSMFFLTKFLKPILTGQPPKESTLKATIERMDDALQIVENIWLKDSPYLTGQQISIADLIGLCEMEQPRAAGYDVTQGRPKITAWMKKIKQDYQVEYDEVHKIFNKVCQKSSL